MTRDKRRNEDPRQPPGEGFLSRWSRRKRRISQPDQEAADRPSEPDLGATTEQADLSSPSSVDDEGAIADETDADMPPIESLDENSDYSRFMSPNVSAELRRLALRKLFHQPKFNIRDKLDCHAGDFTKFEALGDTITADMRHQLERTAQDGVDDKLDEPAVDDQIVSQQLDQQSVAGRREATPGLSYEDREDQLSGKESRGDDETELV